MDYQGLKLSFQRRAASGVRLDGNWTWGRCLGGHVARGGGGAGDTGGGGIYNNPADLDYDRGHCDWDQTHLANFTVGYLSPQLTGGVLRRPRVELAAVGDPERAVGRLAHRAHGRDRVQRPGRPRRSDLRRCLRRRKRWTAT